MTARSLVTLTAALAALALPLTALAQEAEPPAPLSADHPGFSDSSATVGARSYQIEVGLDATKLAGGPLNASANALGRIGVFDGLELRVELPGVTAALDLDGRASTQFLFETIEAGAKLGIPLGEGMALALVPHLVVPTTLGEGPDAPGGAQLGVVFDMGLAPGLALNAYVAPKLVFPVFEDAGVFDNPAFSIDASASITLGLAPELSLFFEGWVNATPDTVTPAGDMGLVYLISREMLVDAYFGVQVPEAGLTPYGGLGFAILMR